ncbi:hypothetical protein B2G71_20595 [Novosphingobium sp. PC22D]|nr:hypothetical protein B2G71_20595 [Novosphingobium sp. PC22D]
MIALMRRLRRDSRGVAVTEFAVWTTAMFFAIMTAMDFAGFYLQRGQINEALSAAAITAFKERDNVPFDDVSATVRNLAENPNLAVTLSCNGVANECENASRSCGCLSSTGTYTAKECGQTCTGTGMTAGSTAGYYLTINARQDYTPVLVPFSVLGDKAVEQSVTVRLE